jgi:hypothetical protein
MGMGMDMRMDRDMAARRLAGAEGPARCWPPRAKGESSARVPWRRTVQSVMSSRDPAALGKAVVDESGTISLLCLYPILVPGGRVEAWMLGG